MITILIADDEKNIRAGIHKILAESIAYDIRYLEAKNGEEAFELVKKERPELMITDIRMPKMDGVELMRKSAELENRPAIIVLSGFDEFSYAKEAIRYGVVSYILKPVDKTELVSVVTGTITEIEKKRKNTIEKTIQQVMSEGRMVRASIPGNFSFEAPFKFIMITGFENSGQIPAIAGNTNCYVLERKSDCICILVRETEVDTLVAGLSGEQMRIGISAICNSLANLRTAWRQAELASLSGFFEIGTHVFSFIDSRPPFDRTDFNARMQKMNMLLDAGDDVSLARCIEELFTFDSIDPEDRSGYLYILHDYIGTGIIKKYWEYADADMYLTLKSIMIENIYLFRSLEDYKKTVLDYVIYLNSLLKRGHTEFPFITEALEYINAHYTEDINMTVVANHVSVNYTYFSEKFKEHTGVNFNDYLKKLRIDEAKRLLEKGCFKVYEVSANSGFGDVKYFMKTFKEITGLSPGEYRKKF